MLTICPPTILLRNLLCVSSSQTSKTTQINSDYARSLRTLITNTNIAVIGKTLGTVASD